MRNLLGNLFSNATDYAFKKQFNENRITLKISNSYEENIHYIFFEFTDNGKGMSEEKAKNIFKVSHNPNGAWPKIYHRIIRMGGDIEVASTINKGTSYRIKFMGV